MNRFLVSASALGFLTSLQAEPLSQPVLERYEQMLLAAPEAGPAFDKIYQHYRDSEGLDSLAKRWREHAGGEGTQKADYLLLLGLLNERRGKTDEALQELRAAAEAGSSWRGWAALAEAESRAGRLEAAIASYKKAISLQPPKDVQARLYRGLALSQQRHMDAAGAVETWEAYAKASPDDPFVLEEAGDALLEAGRYEEANRMFAQLRELPDIDPARALNASLRLAEGQRLQGHKEEALKIYDAALGEAGDASWLQREVRSRIERLFLSDDDLPGLAGYYRKHLAVKPGDLDAALRLSDVLSELNRTDEALKVLQDVADKAPDRKDIPLKLATGLLRAERPADALTVLHTAAQRFPTDLEIVSQLGEAQWQSFKLGKGAQGDAVATWRKLAPENADANAVQRLAEILRSHHLTEEAVAEYRRALALDPTANDRRERFAEYLMELDRKADSLAVLAGMVESGRASGEAYLRLAKMQRRFGESSAARKSLEAGAQFSDRAFDRQYLLWQMAADDQSWEEAEKLAVALRATAGTDPERERADECLIESWRESKKVEGEIRRLLDRQKSAPGSLTESDWSLLHKLADGAADLKTAEMALSGGLNQFPNSAGLTKLEHAFARRHNDSARRLAALERLEKLEPQRAGDWLSERVRALRDDGRSEEAVALARRVVALSPARSEAHLLLADTLLAAQQREEAVKALREAVRLSESPNQVRFRLVDLYLASGEFASARALMDEAFEAEEMPAGKLQLTNRLAQVYLQDGHIDELIQKLRARQKSEQGGWRYAMYLAEVHLVMQDSVRAMEELDKALAGKPDDPVLLKRLLGLAEENGDTQSAVRYARKIAEVEPSKANRAQLGNALANDGRLDEALHLVRENSTDFLADPSAWQELLRALQAEEKGGELATLLEGKLRADPRDWRSLMALGEILMGAGQTDRAAECFWKVVAIREDASTPPQPAPTPASLPSLHPGMPPVAISNRGTIFVSGLGFSGQGRQMRLGEIYQRAMQMLASPAPATPYFQRGMRLRFGSALPQAAGPATLSSTQDEALVYLACIAARDGREPEFLKKLADALQDRPAEERIDIYSMLQTPEAVLAEIEARLAVGSLDPKVINTAYNTVQMIRGNRQNNPGFQSAGIPEERLKELSEKLGSQVAASIQPQNAMQKYQWLISLGKQEEAKKLVEEFFAGADTNDVAQMVMAMQFALMRQDFDRALEFRTKLLEARKKTGQTTGGGDDFGLIMALLSQEKYREQAFDLLAEKLRSPAQGPTLNYGRMSRPIQWPQLRGGNLSQVIPVPTADLDANRINILRSLGYNNSTIKQLLPELAKHFSGLAKEHKDSALPQAAIWLRWFANDRAGAEKEMLALLAAQPSDELALNAALMQLELKNPQEARKTLGRIQARSGGTFELTTRLRLFLALEEKDAAATKALLVPLQGVRLDEYEQRELIQALTRLGLAEEAAKLEKRVAGARHPGQRARQMADVMREQLEKGDRGEASAIASALLARDPFSRTVRNDRYLQEQAVRALQKFGELDSYIDRLKTQLQAAPDSARLNAQLALALQVRDPKSAEPYYRKLAELRPKDPEWLQQFGNILLQAEKHDEAMQMYDRILEQNPMLLFAQGTNFLEPYRRTKSWQRLSDAIRKSPDAKPDPLNPYRQNFSHIFLQVGKELQRAGVDPTDVWLKGLSWDETNSAQLRPQLAQALARAGRKEEARQVIEGAFFPPGREESTVKVFVFNRNVRPNNLWSQWSSYGNGVLESGAVRLLQVAHSLGLLEELLPKIEKVPASPDGSDPKTMARLVMRDPAALPEIRKLVEKSTTTSGNPVALRFYASELADWPLGRELSYRCFEEAARMAASGQDHNTVMAVQFQRASLALENGKMDVVKSALQGWRQAQANWQKQGAQMDFPSAVAVLKMMASVGMADETKELLAALKADRNYNQAHYQRLVRQAENEIAVSLGKPAVLSAALAWTPSGDSGQLIWDLRPATESENEERTVWMGNAPLQKVSGKYALDVYFGRSENEMKRLFSKPAAAARGEWTGSLPAAQGFLRAVLRQGDEMVFGPAVPAATGTLLVSPGLLEQLPLAKNGKAPGWANVPPVPATLEQGGPIGTGKYLRLDGDRQTELELIAERIPADPKKNYLLGCWLRYSQNAGNARLGVRIYDAAGKEIDRYTAGGNYQGDRWNFATQRLGRLRNSLSLTDRAAWIEPFVEFSGRCDLQGFFVVETASEGAE